MSYGEGCIARPVGSAKNEVRGDGVTGPSIDLLFLKLLLLARLPGSERAGLRLVHGWRGIDSVATWGVGARSTVLHVRISPILQAREAENGMACIRETEEREKDWLFKLYWENEWYSC